MTEFSSLPGGEQRISRRDLLFTAALAAAALAGHELSSGVRLRPPELYLQTREIGEIEWLADIGEATLFKSDGKLLFDPSGDFFTMHTTFQYVHRGGNSSREIQISADMGANLFDIDANNARGVWGGIYAEHGVIPGFEINAGRLNFQLYLPVVIDVDEMELNLWRPDNTYAETIEQISMLGDERRMAVSTELKRGGFERDTLIEVLDIHQTYGIPVILHSPYPDHLSSVGDELVAYYNSLE